MTNALPSSWRMVKLGDCLQRRKETVMPSTMPDSSVGLVGLEDIEDGGRGGVTVRRTPPRAIESLKTRFLAGDILYGKLRPNLNKVGIVKEPGLCSTEIWAFGRSELLDSRFAAYFLASSFFVDRVLSMTKGANLPRLDTEAFDSIEIPIPPRSEQQRIVELLQEAEAIRRLHAEAEAKASELIPAAFHDAVAKGEASRRGPLGQWFDSKPNYGTMTPADEGTGSDGLVCLRVGNIQKNRIDLSDRKYVQRSAIHPERHTVKTGDIVLARAIASEEHLGKAVVITSEEDGFAFDSHLMRIRLRKAELSPEFLQVYLYSAQGRNAFLKQARQSAVQFNVNAEEMARVLVPNVHPRHQMEIVEAIKEAESICKFLEASTTLSEMLSGSLSPRAFSGQLTADWREAHAGELTIEARERDAALKQAGATLARSSRAAIQKMESIVEQRTDSVHLDLNREQRDLFAHILDQFGAGGRLRYFSTEHLGQTIDGALRRNPHAIEGHLVVLAARGLVIPVSREEQTADTGQSVFGNAYRLPLQSHTSNLTDEAGNAQTTEGGDALQTEGTPGDHSRLRELERLAIELTRKSGTR